MVHAQATPTASRLGDLKIGGGFSTADSDYGHRFNGGSAYFDFDFLPHIGVEGRVSFRQGPSDLYEKTYEVGGRYYRIYRKFVPYAKVMYGRGVFNFPPVSDGFQPNLAYNLIAGGLGADYRVKPWLYVRADWEYQTLVRLPELQPFAKHSHHWRSLSLPVAAILHRQQSPGQRRGFSS